MQAHSLDETLPFFVRYPVARSAASFPIPALAWYLLISLGEARTEKQTHPAGPIPYA